MSDQVMGVAPSWIEAHCVVPDGFRKGEQFRLYDYQLLYLANFYLVREDAQWRPEAPVLAPAFVYRRGLLVGPQKVGKDPLIAAHICVEGVGPALFAGFAAKDEGYACRDHGCRCGWEYAYELGEPKGMRWPTPLIQITAFSEEQTDNTYDALRPMIDDGPLHDLVPRTGEEFIRLFNGGRIDTVTSSHQSRLGQRVTFVVQGEVGIWTKRNQMTKVAETQYRGLAGMGGRAALITNAWDPAEHSVAQQQFESSATDVYRQFIQPPKNLSYANKRERHKIHRLVYPRDTLRQYGGHVDLDAIEAEAADLIVRDETQAKRFFGNIPDSAAGRAFDIEIWNSLAIATPKVVPDDALITLGFDGSRRWDATALIATEIATGYQWPLGIWQRPEDVQVWEAPADEIDAAVIGAFERYEVWSLYCDPPYWESTIAAWAGRWGDKRVFEWWTNRTKPMAYALSSWREAQTSRELSHCAQSEPGCGLFSAHVGNAFRFETGYRDDTGVNLWVVMKEQKNSLNKIDAVPAAALSWEARNDAIAGGALDVKPSVYEKRGVVTV
jgi:hypothetical protein